MLNLDRLHEAARPEGGVSRRLFLAYAAALSAVPLPAGGPRAGPRAGRRSRPTRSPSASRRATRPPAGSSSGRAWPPSRWSRAAGWPPENVEVRWEVAGDDAMKQVVRRGTASPRRSSATRSTSRSTAWSPTAGTGTASAPATPRARSAAPARCPRPTRSPMSCGSPSPRASTSRRACSPPTSTWPRTTSTWSSTWATTSTRARAATARSASTSGRRSRSLEDYRIRHAQYKTDPLLQAMHARCPWVVTWDDHEFDNNYAGDDLRGEGGRPGRLPGASGQRLPGVLRDDAAAPAVAAARPAHAALPHRLVRPAGRVPGARHPPVPHRPAQRRRQQPP